MGIAKISVFLLFLSQSLLRPSLFAIVAPSWGTYALYATALALIVLTIYLTGKVNRGSGVLAFMGGTWVLAVFLLLQAYMAEGGVQLPVIYSSIFITTAGASLLIVAGELWRPALKAIVWPTIMFCVSGIVTGLLFAAGISLESLEITRWSVEGLNYVYVVYVPFSISMNFTPFIVDMQLARLVGHMREPGILSLLIVFAYFSIDYLGYKRVWAVKTVLFIGLLLTFSTAGMMAFVVAIVCKYIIIEGVTLRVSLSNLKKVVSVAVVSCVSWIFTFSDTRFALMSKLEQGSGQSRTNTIMQTVDILGKYPVLGVGYPNDEASSIAFIGAAAQIGVLGTLIVLALFVVPILYYLLIKDIRAVILIPIVLGAVFAQPLFDKPITYLAIGVALVLPSSASKDFIRHQV